LAISISQLTETAAISDIRCVIVARQRFWWMLRSDHVAMIFFTPVFAQMAGFGGIPGMDALSAGGKTSAGSGQSGSREQRRGSASSTSSLSKSKEHHGESVIRRL